MFQPDKRRQKYSDRHKRPERPCTPAADESRQSRAARKDGTVQPKRGRNQFNRKNGAQNQQAPQQGIRYFLRLPIIRNAAPASSVRALPAEDGSISGEGSAAIAATLAPIPNKAIAKIFRITYISSVMIVLIESLFWTHPQRIVKER